MNRSLRFLQVDHVFGLQVGLVAEMMEDHTEMEIGGTLQQRITSCLQVMDTFLRQKEAPIVSSMVVAQKRSGSGGADNIVDAVANILGMYISMFPI